jgi:hypothetical protein
LRSSGGALASAELERLLLRGDGISRDEKRALRGRLLRYCEEDTRATVGVLGRLREIAGGNERPRDRRRGNFHFDRVGPRTRSS